MIGAVSENESGVAVGPAQGTDEKRVSWAELFFDLVFVVAVTRVSSIVNHDHSGAGLVRALVVFVPVYWLWVGTAIQTNQRDASRPGLRLRIFAVALAAVFMAIALPAAYGQLGMVFALAYWAGRIALGLNVAWEMRSLASPYGMSMTVTGPLLVIGAATHGDVREVIWAAAAILDLSTPTLFQRRLRLMHIDAAHLAERFGLFVLIAIGESVVSVASSTTPGTLTTSEGSAVAAAFVFACGLWWVYFQFANDAMRYALATARVQLHVTRLVLSYGHLSFIGAVIVVAVGLHDSIAHPTHPLAAGVAGLLFGGTALYLATFGFTRWAMFRLVSWTRLSAAAAVIVLVPVGIYADALVSLIALAIVVVALNVVEYARVEQIGWRTLTAKRSADEAASGNER